MRFCWRHFCQNFLSRTVKVQVYGHEIKIDILTRKGQNRAMLVNRTRRVKNTLQNLSFNLTPFKCRTIQIGLCVEKFYRLTFFDINILLKNWYCTFKKVKQLTHSFRFMIFIVAWEVRGNWKKKGEAIDFAASLKLEISFCVIQIAAHPLFIISSLFNLSYLGDVSVEWRWKVMRYHVISCCVKKSEIRSNYRTRHPTLRLL
jgi:hypothetical protein